MAERTKHAVTGAFGYTGKYIAQRLLDQGKPVITLTNSVRRENPFGDRLEVHPFSFSEPDKLRASLADVAVLYNTYWVRFNQKEFTHAEAVRNTKTLFQCAKDAGVERIVHVSITNPSLNSPLEYFRGKAELEEALKASGLSYAIVRPAVIFGGEDILINNIAWVIRTLPVVGVFGTGLYRLQPIHVEDFADLAVALGARRDDVTVDAIGPETFTFRELIRAIGDAIGETRPIISVPLAIGHVTAKIIGALVGDVMLTREEIQGLMDDLLHTDSPPAGSTKLTDWARAHADTLGKHYASELGRRRDRQQAYEKL
jgi:uncharacterized protein YbjT (DUF2867 family)